MTDQYLGEAVATATAPKGNPQALPANILAGGYTQQVELIRSMLGKAAICTIVQVEAVNTTNKTVNVMPLIYQVDGNGKPWDQNTVFNLPYVRWQGGTNAIILNPVVGDIGVCFVCHHDTSTVRKTKKKAMPGSFRQNSISDGIYLGGILNGGATTAIEFMPNGDITITAGKVTIDGQLWANGHRIDQHQHGGVQTGSGNTGNNI